MAFAPSPLFKPKNRTVRRKRRHRRMLLKRHVARNEQIGVHTARRRYDEVVFVLVVEDTVFDRHVGVHVIGPDNLGELQDMLDDPPSDRPRRGACMVLWHVSPNTPHLLAIQLLEPALYDRGDVFERMGGDADAGPVPVGFSKKLHDCIGTFGSQFII